MIRFDDVEVRFGDQVAIPGLDLEIHEGEFFTLLGPSGCGKTTALRTLAGFVEQAVPVDELQRYIPSVSGVDPAAVQRVAQSLMDPSRASIVVVGDAKEFVDALKKDYPQLEVIPADKVNLDSATLK